MEFIVNFLTLMKNESNDTRLYFGVLNLINYSNDFLFEKNKKILNLMFNEKFKSDINENFGNQKFNLENFEHFKFAFNKTMEEKNQYLYSILLLYVITPNLFKDYKIKDDKMYKIKMLRYMIQKAERRGAIYRNITYFCKDLRSNFTYYFAYSGTSNKIIYELICRLMRLICPALNFEKKNFIKNQKVKIGFFGNNMTFNHSIANNQLGTFEYLANDERFDVYAVTYKNEGVLNEYFENNKSKILLIGELSEKEDCIDTMIKKMCEYNFDIIVYTEIGMDLVFKCLAHCRLAKCQMNTWGHSETSGIDTVDYYISSKYFENEKSQEDNYTEKLIVMNSLSTFYHDKISKMFENINQRNMLRQVNRSNKFKLNENSKLYGCLQLYHKFDDSFLRTTKQILNKDVNAYILILNYKEQETNFKNYIKQIKNNERIIFVDKCDLYTYCQYIDACDVIIDNINFGGCNSTLQAFTLGKIVVAFPQQTLCTNFTSGFYKKINYVDPICNSEEEYVEKAIHFANLNEDEKILLSTNLSDMSRILYDEKESCNDWLNMMLKICAQK